MHTKIKPWIILVIAGLLVCIFAFTISHLIKLADPPIYVVNEDSDKFRALCEENNSDYQHTEVAFTFVGFLVAQGGFGQKSATAGLRVDQIGPCPYQFSRLTTTALDIYAVGLLISIAGIVMRNKTDQNKKVPTVKS